MFTQRFETKLEYAPEIELYIPEQNNPKRLYRARYELLGRPSEFPTRTPDSEEALKRAFRHIQTTYIIAMNPSSPEDANADRAEDRAQDVFDRELGRAFGKVRTRSDLVLLQGILDGLVRGRLRTSESMEAFLKAKGYVEEKEEVDQKRKDELNSKA